MITLCVCGGSISGGGGARSMTRCTYGAHTCACVPMHTRGVGMSYSTGGMLSAMYTAWGLSLTPAASDVHCLGYIPDPCRQPCVLPGVQASGFRAQGSGHRAGLQGIKQGSGIFLCQIAHSNFKNTRLTQKGRQKGVETCALNPEATLRPEP